MVVYDLNDYNSHYYDLHKCITDTCKVEAVFRKVIKHCRDAYSWTDDDTKDYLTGWVKPTPGNMRRHSLKDCYMEDLLGNETSLRSIILDSGTYLCNHTL